MRISMNTALSGSGRVDDIKGHPQGEIRGLTKLVNITEDVRKPCYGTRPTGCKSNRVRNAGKEEGNFSKKAPRYTLNESVAPPYACHAEIYEGGSRRSLVVQSLCFSPREDFLKTRIFP